MSSDQNQQPKQEVPKQSPDEILNKLNTFVVNSVQPKVPPPLPHLNWITIDALEASLLVSVVSTSITLHSTANLAGRHWHPRLVQTLRNSVERWSQIMRPAAVLSSTLNKMRDGTFQGNPALLEVILGVLRQVRDTHNPALADVQIKTQGEKGWVDACWGYVKGMVASVEHSASVLRNAGFS